MIEIITTLHPKDTPTDSLYPNIKSDNIPNGAVTSAKIGSNAVTSAKIVNSAISTLKINDGAVTEPKIANNAVSTDKIGDSAVTTIKINDNAVTSDKILDNAITTNKILDNAITLQKMGFHLYRYNVLLAYTNADSKNIIINFSFDSTNDTFDELMTNEYFIDNADFIETCTVINVTDSLNYSGKIERIIIPNTFKGISAQYTPTQFYGDTSENTDIADFTIVRVEKIQIF